MKDKRCENEAKVNINYQLFNSKNILNNKS